MAGDMDSDACVGSKRRIIEIEETLFPLPQEPPNSATTVLTQESLKESSAIDSSPKEDQEIMQDIPSPSSSNKVKCSFTEPHESIKENQNEDKVIRFNLVSASSEREENCEDFARKVENFGVQLQESKNCLVGFVSNGENCSNVIEGPVKDAMGDIEKEIVRAEGEVGFYGVEELDKHALSEECKAVDMETCPIIEEKKELFKVEETETQNLLEAKKKQLLAKLEDGSILKDKILGGLKGIDESFRPSLEVAVIDETALIEAVPVPKTGDGVVKIGQMNGKKNEKQEADGKKARRSRRKGKDGKNVLVTSDKQKKMTQIGKVMNKLSQVGETQNCSRKNGDQLRKYSREELEALRLVNIVEQQKLWSNIYTGLGDAAVKKYDDLASSKQQKNTRLNFDPRQRFGRKANIHWIPGEASSENGDIELENMDEVENLCHLDSALSQNVGGEDANSSFEGECNEERDSDEDYASIQRPAFLVEGEPDFDSGPPEDGWEYLRRVRWEASRIPKVKVAKLERSKVNREQSIYMPQIPEIAKCPENLMPLKQWEDAFVADFSELRMFLSRNEGSCTEISCKLQSIAIVHKQNTSSAQLAESIILEKFNNLRTDEVHSQKLLDASCLDNTNRPSEANAEDSKILGCSQNTSPISSVTDSSCNYPTLSAISAMDSVARVSMLRKRISLAETMSTLSKIDCVWLFALCAAVDTPLDADTSAALRSLLRKCASLRTAKTEPDDEVIMLNILTTISGRYFGQSET